MRTWPRLLAKMSEAEGEFARTCLILYFSADRLKVHSLPKSVDQGNYTVALLPRLYSVPLDDVKKVDIVIYDIATKTEAALAEPLVQKYHYVVNRWISFNWKYPLFDVAVKYDLMAMGRRAMNHRRGLHREMAPLDQEVGKLAARLGELLDRDKSGSVEFPDFAAAALDLGISVTDAQFQTLLDTVNPGSDQLTVKAIEDFLRYGGEENTLKAVISKLISVHELTETLSSTYAKRFGVTRVHPMEVDCKVSIGSGDITTGASVDVNLSNKISDAEWEDLAIGELLPVERENCFMLAWDLCPDISDAMAEEYVENWFRHRHFLESMAHLSSSFRSFTLATSVVSWKFRLRNRRLYVFGIVSLPMLISASKKFDSFSSFLDPDLMTLRLNAHLSTQSNLLDLFSFNAERLGSVLLQRAEGSIKAFICENVQKLIEQFTTYAMTASSVKDAAHVLESLLTLLTLGKLDFNLPTLETLPETFLSTITTFSMQISREIFAELSGLFGEKVKFQYYTVSFR